MIAVLVSAVRSDFTSILNTQMEELKDIANRVQSAAAVDFSFKRGLMYNFGLEACNTLVEVGLTCMANNPTTPYGIIMVPPPEGEVEDLSECGGKRKPICAPNENGETISNRFHLNSSEAIIVLGVTPPEVNYFGFTNYLAAHTYPPDFKIAADVGAASRCWEEGSTARRCNVFASLGDALNFGNLKAHGNGTGVFSRQFAMVITPSQTTFEQLATTLKESGITIVNNLPIAGDGMNFGFNADSDTFTTLLRTAVPANRTLYDAWLDSSPFVVLRATPTKEVAEKKIYPRPEYCDPGMKLPPPTGTYCLTKRSKVSEAERMNTTMDHLRGAQRTLVDVLQRKVNGWWWGNSQTTFFSSGSVDNGFVCIDKGQKCQGDTRDTYYPASRDFLKNSMTRGMMASGVGEALGFEPLTYQEMHDKTWSRARRATLTSTHEDTMYVVGVLHSNSDVARYSSVSVYHFWNLQGTMSVLDSQLQGSAKDYLKDTEYADIAQHLYVAEFTRGRCNDRQFCFDVPSTGTLSIPEEVPLLFIERMYYDETTGIGVDPEAVIPAAIVHNALQFEMGTMPFLP